MSHHESDSGSAGRGGKHSATKYGRGRRASPRGSQSVKTRKEEAKPMQQEEAEEDVIEDCDDSGSQQHSFGDLVDSVRPNRFSFQSRCVQVSVYACLWGTKTETSAIVGP